MFVALVFLYLFVGFLVSTSLLRDDRMREDLPFVVLALGVGAFWLPVAIAAVVLVTIDAALSVSRV
jgi:hypothetical protein